MNAGIWPDYVAVEADGYGVRDDPTVDRTPFGRPDPPGAPLLQRHDGARDTVLIESDADYRRFRAWARENAHRWFAWTAPESGAHQARRPRWRRRDRVHGARRRRQPASWEATLTLEGIGL